jgi:group I intron endonuclease
MAKEKLCGIYCIENLVNGKKYIGLSINIKQRWTQHKTDLRHQYHKNSYLQNAWNKYGEDNFGFNIIQECKKTELSELEKFYIDKFDTTNEKYGYNLTFGGEECIHTKQSKEKLSKARIEHSNNSPNTQKVVQLNMFGQIVKVFNTVNEINRLLGYDTKGIRGCLNKEPKRKTGYNCIWMYYQDFLDNGCNLDNYKTKYCNKSKNILQLNLDGNVINEFKSINYAGKILDIPTQNISRCLLNRTKTAGGFMWKYA